VNYYKELDDKVSIDYFKKDHQIEFWNSIWYFELHGIDISFILPYYQKEKYNIDISSHVIDNKIDLDKIKIETLDEDEELIIEKNDSNKKYEKDDLCVQIVHQFAFIKYFGMVSYKNIYYDILNISNLLIFS